MVRRRHIETLLLLSPAVVFLVLLFVVPLARLFSLAFADEAGALSTFTLLAQSEVYRRVLVNTFVVALAVTGKTGGLAATGAWLWLAARIVYVLLYAAGVRGVRTLAWVISIVGLVLMLVRLMM